jgi:hypothetical protein
MGFFLSSTYAVAIVAEQDAEQHEFDSTQNIPRDLRHQIDQARGLGQA